MKSFRKEVKSKDEFETNQVQDFAHLTKWQDVFAASNDESAWTSRTRNILRQLTQRKSPNHPLNNVWKALKELDIWISAYAKLSRSSGSLTSGTDGLTIDGNSFKNLSQLQHAVLSGSFQWGTTRRVWIPKPLLVNTQRPLFLVPVFQDRLVQEVLRLILEAIFGPEMYPCSHGFRPGHGQHSSVRYIRAWFPSVVWYVEGDIQACFDTIDHDVLMKLIRRRIKDKKFTNLIQTGLTSNVLLNGSITQFKTGTPQGSVLSPTLCNIYLHELDKFMLRLQNRINTPQKRRPNPAHKRLSNLAQRRRNAGQNKLAAQASRLARQMPQRDPMDPNYVRLRYVRYADDFLIGIIGSHALAKRVKHLIGRFLGEKLKLQLSVSKTHITHCKHRIPWLGYHVHTGNVGKVIRARYSKRGLTLLKRSARGNVSILVDRKRALKNLSQKGFCFPSGRDKPNWAFLHPPQTYSVAQAQKLLTGLNAYFAVCNDRRAAVHYFMTIVRSSLAKTFAAKFKLGSRRKVYARAGADLSLSLKSKSWVGAHDETQIKHALGKKGLNSSGSRPYIPYTKYKFIPKPDFRVAYETPLQGETVMQDPFARVPTMTLKAKSTLLNRCLRCGSQFNIQMHHVRRLKHLTQMPWIKRRKISLNRKMIPLCARCHKLAHGAKSEP